MKIIKSIFSNKTFLRALWVSFFIGIVIGANIAFKEDSGDNLPISILMIFAIPIFIIAARAFRKKKEIENSTLLEY